MSTAPRLRFGILCQNRRLAAWEAECIERLVSSGHAEPVLWLRDARPPEPVPRSSRTALFRLYRARWLRRFSRALREVELPASLARMEQVECTDIAAVKRSRLDFILRLGSSGSPGDGMLQAARFGVWSHDHGGRAAPCFWELIHGEATTEVTLRRLAEGEDGGMVLHRGFFGTCRASWVNNLDRAHFGCADWSARVCAEIRLGRTSAAERPGRNVPTRLRPDRAATNLEFLRFLLRSSSHVVAKLWELLVHVEVWNVGFTERTVEEIVRAGEVDPTSVIWCKPHALGRFIADPFVYQQGGREHVLVEDLDAGGKGRICSLLPPHGLALLELEVELERPYHMSYPCIFVEDGEVYCVPETYQDGRVSLYQRAGGEWKRLRTMLEGQPVVDPTLFKHRGLYWLFFTLQDDGASGNLRLHGYHARHLLGDWRPHALNPLKCDIRSSRPAGSPLIIDGDLVRPSQDCSLTYGGAVVMNRIVKLSPTEFEEVAAARIEPTRRGPLPDGLHTINATRRGAVIDGKKLAFDPLAWRKNRGRFHEVFR